MPGKNLKYRLLVRVERNICFFNLSMVPTQKNTSAARFAVRTIGGTFAEIAAFIVSELRILPVIVLRRHDKILFPLQFLALLLF